MANVTKQIIGSFEDIGKNIARETVNVPKDIVGKALESLGTSSQTGQKGNPVTGYKTTEPKEPEKPVPARQWLTELAGGTKKQREPTVQERLEKDKQDKNEKEIKQAETVKQMAPIPNVSTKRRRGQLFGQTNASLDTSKNIRQD